MTKQETQRRWAQRVKLKCFALFGSQCARCAFTDPRALQVDHINGAREDSNHRYRSGNGLYQAILRGLVPQADHQLLCANCNWIKRFEEGEQKGYKAVRHG